VVWMKGRDLAFERSLASWQPIIHVHLGRMRSGCMQGAVVMVLRSSKKNALEKSSVQLGPSASLEIKGADGQSFALSLRSLDTQALIAPSYPLHKENESVAGVSRQELVQAARTSKRLPTSSFFASLPPPRLASSPHHHIIMPPGPPPSSNASVSTYGPASVASSSFPTRGVGADGAPRVRRPKRKKPLDPTCSIMLQMEGAPFWTDWRDKPAIQVLLIGKE